jgi:type IV secretion system protein VirB6
MSFCPGPSSDLGVIRSVLGTVDCHVRTYSEAGYLALTGPQSFFPAALTILLTIYVALLGLRLMFGIGQARLADAPVMAMKIGLILTLTLNWTTFQTLVFDLTAKAPLEVARIVAAPARASGSDLASNPLNGLQVAYDQLALDAAAFGKAAGPNPQVLRGGEAAAASGLWKAQTALFMSTAGLMAIASIAVGVLTTIGPIFIALFLFDQTRGLFAGWLRAIIAASLTPMLCWITTAVLLVVIDPWLSQLAQQREGGALDLQTATILSSVIFIFATAQAALTFGAVVIAGGFQFSLGRHAAAPAAAQAATAVAAESITRAERLAMQLQRSSATQRLGLAGGGSGAGAGAGASAGGSAPGSAAAGQDLRPRAARIGDAYRREAHFDRFRKLDRSA